MNGKPQRVMLPRGVCRDYHSEFLWQCSYTKDDDVNFFAAKGYCSRGSLCKYSHASDAFVPPNMPFPPVASGAQMFNGFMPFMGNGMPFPMGQGSNVPYDPSQAHMDMRLAPVGGRHGELPVVQDLTPNSIIDEGASVDPTGEFEIIKYR